MCHSTFNRRKVQNISNNRKLGEAGRGNTGQGKARQGKEGQGSARQIGARQEAIEQGRSTQRGTG